MSKQVKKYSKWILIVALLFLMLPSVLRALDGNVYLMGDESYYHARMAENIVESGIPETDALVFNGRDYVFNPYHLLLACFTFVFGAVTASKIVPLLLGLLCVYLFYLILSNLKIEAWTKLVMLGLLILSPVFIYTFNVSTQLCLILVLNLAGLFFLMKKGTVYTIFSVIFFSIAAMFGVSHALVSAFIVFFYAFRYKKRLRKGYLIIAAVVFVMLSYSLPVYLNAEKAGFLSLNILSSFFADLGGAAGISVFAALLALVGYTLVWRYKRQYYLLYVFSILLITYSFFNNALLIYSNLIIVFLAGIAFVHFARMRWSLKILRDFTLIVLFCGLMFSAFTTVFSLQEALPNTPMTNSLIWLNLNSEETDVVFSHYSNGFWIEFVSKRPVIMDCLLQHTPGVNDLYFDSKQVFETDDLDKARELMSKYDVKYVIITKNFYDGLVWDKKEKGLDFLLTNVETFKKVQENSYVVIYEYIYEGVEN
ncbi:hypothetical protein KY338_00900 [Candidatus Woesearchaeota archaeon]|nr:hypothetical protein [Candidatus Woesearchaeota archaeon]MBW3006155.1 hypothetical protein [Candidatus Woesearchaeota archaeon]